MRIVSIKSDHSRLLAALSDDGYLPLAVDETPFASAVELIRACPSIDDLKSALQGAEPVVGANVQIEAPIQNPGKIICIGKNYAKHAREMGADPPSIPVVFSKFNSAISAPDTNIMLPAISQKVDFEAELVVVIGKRGKLIDRKDALSHVFGYCCGNDISARDWQKEKPGGQWLLGKTFDGFAPLGPAIVTADEVSDPHNLDISLRLNGETMQSSNTRNLIFPIDFLISHLSQFVTLDPGDLIFTGTPEGVGAGRTPPVFLKSGDRLEVEISEIGVLRNQIVDC